MLPEPVMNHIQSSSDSPWMGHSCEFAIFNLKPHAKCFRNNLGFPLSISKTDFLKTGISVDQKAAAEKENISEEARSLAHTKKSCADFIFLRSSPTFGKPFLITVLLS